MVVTVSRVDSVVAGTAIECVVAALTADAVVTTQTVDDVDAVPTGDGLGHSAAAVGRRHQGLQLRHVPLGAINELHLLDVLITADEPVLDRDLVGGADLEDQVVAAARQGHGRGGNTGTELERVVVP